MDKASLARYTIAILTALNTVLTALGYAVIPDELINAIVIIAGFVFEAYVLFKNNYLTKKGLKQYNLLKSRGLTK